MSGLWEVARETLRFLSSREELADLTFCEDFPAAAKESPLRRITVAVGLEQADCVPDALGHFWGDSAGGTLTGAPWKLRIRLQIHAPNRLGGAACRKPSRAFGKRSILTRPSLLPPPDAALSARAGKPARWSSTPGWNTALFLPVLNRRMEHEHTSASSTYHRRRNISDSGWETNCSSRKLRNTSPAGGSSAHSIRCIGRRSRRAWPNAIYNCAHQTLAGGWGN